MHKAFLEVWAIVKILKVSPKLGQGDRGQDRIGLIEITYISNVNRYKYRIRWRDKIT